MFKYENNGKLSKPGEAQNKVVTKMREVTYVNRLRKDHKTFEKVSKGWEIVEERVVSPNFVAPKAEYTGEAKTVTTVVKKREKLEDEANPRDSQSY